MILFLSLSGRCFNLVLYIHLMVVNLLLTVPIIACFRGLCVVLCNLCSLMVVGKIFCSVGLYSLSFHDNYHNFEFKSLVF